MNIECGNISSYLNVNFFIGKKKLYVNVRQMRRDKVKTWWNLIRNKNYKYGNFVFLLKKETNSRSEVKINSN